MEEKTDLTAEQCTELHAKILTALKVEPPAPGTIIDLRHIADRIREKINPEMRAFGLLETFADDIDAMCDVWQAQRQGASTPTPPTAPAYESGSFELPGVWDKGEE